MKQNKKIYRHDPLASFLLDKLRLNPIKVMLIISTVAATYCLLHSPGSIVIWLWRVLFYPSIAGYYLWSSESMTYLLTALERKSVVMITEYDWNLVDKIYQNPLWKYLSISFASLSGILFLFMYSLYGETIALFSLLKTFGRMLGVYMTVMTIIVLIVNAWLIQRILESKELQIEPLHSDGCGGLGALSKYSLKTAYLVATFGVILGLVEYRLIIHGVSDELWFIHLSIPVYIILSLTAFFVPLLTAHSKMLSARNTLLDDISKQFQKDFNNLIQSTAETDTDLLSKRIEKVKQLNEIYERSKIFPIWPIDIQSLRRYTLSLTAPLIPPVIALSQKLVELWIKNSGIFS